MGGPVLPADFNELLWGSDQRHQKQHSVIQPARFNASLLTTVSFLHVMKAPPAGRMTKEMSSKHMWSVIWWKWFAENQGNLTWVGLISLLCWALIYAALRRWRQGYWTGTEALQDMRENITVASLTDAFKTRSMKHPRCVSFEALHLKSRNEEKKLKETRMFHYISVMSCCLGWIWQYKAKISSK